MGRIMAIDYGKKRTGIAVTDPLKIIAQGLTTVDTHTLRPFLKKYAETEGVERVLIGMPKNLDDTDTHATAAVVDFIRLFKKDFPGIPLEEIDERFTSKRAAKALVEIGMKKKQRQVKGNLDEMAATLMLQEWLQENH